MEKYSPDKKCVVMTREQVRGVDRWAIETLGVAGVVLMENAGRSCAEVIEGRLARVSEPKVCIFCGTGNNGGDGYVIARHLLNRGFGVEVVICGDRSKIKGDAKINLEILERMGRPVKELDLKDDNVGEQIAACAKDADMLVDGIFGTGLKGQLSAEYVRLIDMVNALDKPILAIDIPSGLECDTGRVLGGAVRADCTVTFVAVKVGFTVSQTADAYTGEIFVASIGVEPAKNISD